MTYPFGAVVGMDDLRLALLLNAVSPAVGGVLVRGEKGTAKSTAVRALAAVLPPVDVVAGCRFACDPAAPDPACPDGPHDDRRRPARPARPGWSSCRSAPPRTASSAPSTSSARSPRASRPSSRACSPPPTAGVLYVDEVNLLHDHLVDLLLDAAALGTAYVEREGVSVRHAARFLLVGTMNPEEGELRPQLLDRFGLTVEVAAPRDPAERAEVVRRRFAYDADPAGFAGAWAADEAALAARIADARARLPHVVLSDAALRQVTAVCAAFDVDGLRADLVTARAAIAHAAWCRPRRGHRGRRPGRRPAGAAAPPPAQPLRRPRPGRRDARAGALRRASRGRRPEDDGPDDDGPAAALLPAAAPAGRAGGAQEPSDGEAPVPKAPDDGTPRRGRRAHRRRAGARAGCGRAVRPVPHPAARGARHRRGRGRPALAGAVRARPRRRLDAARPAPSPGCT